LRSLLDINVVIALLDPDHIFQERAHQWWSTNSGRGWASCPLTENRVVRIMSTPGYRQKMRFTPNDVIVRLREFIDKSDHEFWPDDISLLDEELFLSKRIHTPKQITDLYLLALATKHRQRLVTFDQGISLSAVAGAKAENLFCIV
jgi:toxin-antitoxin system PIN domain toxin